MACNNRRLELVAEAISSIFYLPVQSRLQFLEVQVISQLARGDAWLSTCTGASPHSPDLLPTIWDLCG